jgi:hypothetical protein
MRDLIDPGSENAPEHKEGQSPVATPAAAGAQGQKPGEQQDVPKPLSRDPQVRKSEQQGSERATPPEKVQEAAREATRKDKDKAA